MCELWFESVRAVLGVYLTGRGGKRGDDEGKRELREWRSRTMMGKTLQENGQGWGFPSGLFIRVWGGKFGRPLHSHQHAV